MKFLRYVLMIMCLWINFSANVATAPAKENQINVGTVFKDCPMCPEMSVIPSGTFLMGSIKGRKRERPVTKITIPRPLAVGRYEVTFDQWDACFTDGGCSKKPSDRGWGRGSRPIINILLTDIAEYVSWLSRKTGHLYRLPSESEWEYAARAGSQTEFYWGDQMRPGAANCRGCGTQWSGHQSSPVGQFKPNAWGLYDMHGNVLEYVTDCWSKSHDKIPIDGSPKLTDNCLNKVVKGGSWYYLSRVSRSASRARNDKRVFSYFIGFRVFRELKLVKNDETDRMK